MSVFFWIATVVFVERHPLKQDKGTLVSAVCHCLHRRCLKRGRPVLGLTSGLAGFKSRVEQELPRNSSTSIFISGPGEARHGLQRPTTETRRNLNTLRLSKQAMPVRSTRMEPSCVLLPRPRARSISVLFVLLLQQVAMCKTLSHCLGADDSGLTGSSKTSRK